MGFGVCDLGLSVSGFGFRVWGKPRKSGRSQQPTVLLGTLRACLAFKFQGLRFRVSGLGFCVYGFGAYRHSSSPK